MVLWKKKFLKYGSYKTIDKFTALFATLKGVSWRHFSIKKFISYTYLKKIEFILNKYHFHNTIKSNLY